MSSTAHILVGQCGNQLGASFLNALCREAGGGSEALEEEEGETNVYSDSFTCQTTSMMTSAAYHHRVSKAHFRRPLPSRWRSGSGSATEFSPSLSSLQAERHLPEPRCILVDMEPQVVGGLLRRGERTTRAHGSPWGEEGETCSRMDQDADRVGSSAFSSSSSSSSCTNAWYDAERDGEGESGNEAYFGSSSLLSPLFHYSPQQCVTRAEGSGNNWACGYLYQGESRRQAIEDCLARELEAKDSIVHTFHVVHSLAGGTGSGVGSLVGEVVKDMQPHCCSLLHSVVWPFSSGEVVTQWYNMCCTLASLKENADGIHILFNDGMLDQITQYADSVGSRITRYSGDPSIPSTSSTPFLPRLSRDHGVSQIDFSILNAAFADSMLPLHVPQYLCAVPSPKYDPRKQRIPGIQRGGGGRGDSSGDGGDVVSSFSHPSHRSTLERDQRRRAFGSSEGGEDRTGGTTPLRYARMEDVMEAVGAFDPGMKFFTASSMPFSFSSSFATGSPSLGAFPWRAQNDTSWQGVLTEAGRVAQHMYGGGEPPTTCASSCSSARDSFLFSTYAPRSCLWCLSGPEALTDGIHTLQDVLAQFRADHRPYRPSSTFAAEEEGKWKIAPHDTERGVKGESFSSAASAGGTSFPYPSEVLPFPLSSLFVHPRPSFVHSLSGEAKDPTSTPTARTVTTRYPRHQVHLYGPSPRIGIQAEYAAYRAEKLLQVNAFVHHYTKYGLEKSFLKDAVATAYEIAAIYTAAY